VSACAACTCMPTPPQARAWHAQRAPPQALVAGKAYVPQHLTALPDPRSAYAALLADAKRTQITEEELCRFTCGFTRGARFRRRAMARPSPGTHPSCDRLASRLAYTLAHRRALPVQEQRVVDVVPPDAGNGAGGCGQRRCCCGADAWGLGHVQGV
jgi:hypothetical protein